MSDDFVSQLGTFTEKVKVRTQAAFVGTVAEVKNSIVFGSPLTGAPGQVVADYMGGTLRDSWQVKFESPTVALIGTNVPWASSNEDGIARPNGGPYIQRSAVGGRWSVALTRAGIQRIADSEAARLNP
jgi:hypothetical protein